MPVEIKELVIRMTNTDTANPTSTRQGANAETPSVEALVEMCVKQVLKIIEKKQNR